MRALSFARFGGGARRGRQLCTASAPLKERNPHVRDGRVKFYSDDHIYAIEVDTNNRGAGTTCKNTPQHLRYVSATALVSQFTEKFIPDVAIEKMMNGRGWGPDHKYWGMEVHEIKKLWLDFGKDAAQKGDILHKCIENFYNGEDLILKEEERDPDGPMEFYDSFQPFHKDIVENQGLEPYRTEWRVFDDEHRIAGSIDMIFKKPTDKDEISLMMYDWKRTPEFPDENKWANFLSPLSHLPDAKFWHFAVQQNIYRHILETYYFPGTRVEMKLVAMHPQFVKGSDGTSPVYKLREVPRLEEEVEAILNVRRQELDPNYVPPSKSTSESSSVRRSSTRKVTSSTEVKDGATIMDFGKHQGVSYEEVLKENSGYADWALKQKEPTDKLAEFVKYVRQQRET